MIGEYIVIVGLLVLVISQWVYIRNLNASLVMKRQQFYAMGQRLDRERDTVKRLRQERLRLAVNNDRR